jgi:Flp pilus assembly protein TadB
MNLYDISLYNILIIYKCDNHSSVQFHRHTISHVEYFSSSFHSFQLTVVGLDVFVVGIIVVVTIIGVVVDIVVGFGVGVVVGIGIAVVAATAVMHPNNASISIVYNEKGFII